MDLAYPALASCSNTVSVGIGILCLLLGYLILDNIRRYQCLAHIPGPRSASLSKWWMVRATAAGDLYFRLLQVSRQYGHLARIGPNDLVTDDPEVLREINGLRSAFVRSDWYNATAFSHDVNHAFCE